MREHQRKSGPPKAAKQPEESYSLVLLTPAKYLVHTVLMVHIQILTPAEPKAFVSLTL